MLRRRTKDERVEKFGTSSVKDYSMSEAGKGLMYASDLRRDHPWIKYIPFIVLGVVILLIMILL